jgi:micrococcal nuclease
MREPGSRVRRRAPDLTQPVSASVMALVLACSAAGGCGPARPGATTARAPTVPGAAVVEHHVDGDTVDVIIEGREERVRLTGIDTPEVAHEGSANRPGNDAECFGDAAAAHIIGLLPLGTEVRLVRDVVARDDYGRLLAYIFRLSDDLFVNEAMVRDGFAQPLTIPPNVAYAETFVAAARAAEADDIGLWRSCTAR